LLCVAELVFDPIGLRPYPARVVDLVRLRDELTVGSDRFEPTSD
jgi:hypothetical protein